MRNLRSRGFTLIELLVVIAIIGVLAAIAFPAISKSRKKAFTANCMSNLRQIYAAEGSYAADHEGWTTAGQHTESQGGNLTPQSWMGQLVPYLGLSYVSTGDGRQEVIDNIRRSPFWCPAGKMADNVNNYGYGQNGFVDNISGHVYPRKKVYEPAGSAKYGTSFATYLGAESTEASASSILFIADVPHWSTGWAPHIIQNRGGQFVKTDDTIATNFRHGNRAHVLTLAGNVRSILPEEIDNKLVLIEN